MKKLLLFLLLAMPCFAQKQIFQPMPSSLASDPATCSTTGAWYQKFYYNTAINAWKYCSAPNTWTSMGGGGGTLTNAALSLPANQVIVGNGYPDTLTSNCTIGVIATNAILCPGGFYATAQAQDGTAVAGSAVKVSASGWTTAANGDVSDPSMIAVDANGLTASVLYPVFPGSQINLVSQDAVTLGQYILLSATNAPKFTSSATCTAGQRYFGTWAVTAAAGTRAANYNPGMCSASSTNTQTVITADGTGSGSANYQVLTAGTNMSLTTTTHVMTVEPLLGFYRPNNRHVTFVENDGTASWQRLGDAATVTGAESTIAPTTTVNFESIGHTTTNTISTAAGINGNAIHIAGGPNGIIWQAADGLNIITTVRQFSGLTDQTLATQVGADIPAGNYAGIMASTTGTYTGLTDTTHYVFVTKNNTTQVAVACTQAFDTSIHKFMVIENLTDSKWHGYVDGVQCGTGIAVASGPLSGTLMRYVEGVIDLAASARVLSTAYVWVSE